MFMYGTRGTCPSTWLSSNTAGFSRYDQMSDRNGFSWLWHRIPTIIHVIMRTIDFFIFRFVNEKEIYEK
jgi:hypothetical protein